MTPVESTVDERSETTNEELPAQELGAGVAQEIEPDDKEPTPPLSDHDFEGSDGGPLPGETLPAGETETVSADVPIHRAKCMHAGCKVEVVYRPTSTGNGFAILERVGVEHDASFSISSNGRPECPKGHGELTIADDLLDAHEAITQAAQRQEAEARAKASPRLPFPAPPFNHEGALHAIQEKRHEVKQFEREFEQADERRKKAKGRLDEANEALGKLIDDFEEREREREFEIERRLRAAEGGHPEDTTLVRCIYERQHEGQTCPLCVAGAPTFVRGVAIAAKNSDRHLDQVVEYLEDLSIEQLVEQLSEEAGIVVMPGRVREWTPEQRAEVQGYLELRFAGTPSLTIPSVFAGSHIAAAVGENSKLQTCSECGSTLLVFGDADVETNPYPTGTLVGADCPGAAAIDPGHRYPKRDKKKAAARPKAEKPAKKNGKKGGKKRRA